MIFLPWLQSLDQSYLLVYICPVQKSSLFWYLELGLTFLKLYLKRLENFSYVGKYQNLSWIGITNYWSHKLAFYKCQEVIVWSFINSAYHQACQKHEKE